MADVCKIDDHEPNYPYHQETFDLIASWSAIIRKYSAWHHVPPIAVAGSIADEYNVQRGLKFLWNWVQDFMFGLYPSWIVELQSQIGQKNRLLNATRNDIGPGNINIRTARELSRDREYQSAFSRTVSNWSDVIEYIRSPEGTVVVATLVIRQGKRDLAPWLVGRPPEIQEALLITYYKQGPSFVARFKARLAANPGAEIVPGEGCRVYHQRAAFRRALKLP